MCAHVVGGVCVCGGCWWGCAPSGGKGGTDQGGQRGLYAVHRSKVVDVHQRPVDLEVVVGAQAVVARPGADYQGVEGATVALQVLVDQRPAGERVGDVRRVADDALLRVSRGAPGGCSGGLQRLEVPRGEGQRVAALGELQRERAADAGGAAREDGGRRCGRHEGPARARGSCA